MCWSGRMEREPYWEYIGRRLREEKVMDTSLMYQREVFELQKTLQQALIRQKELRALADRLSKKIAILGGDPNQLEMDF